MRILGKSKIARPICESRAKLGVEASQEPERGRCSILGYAWADPQKPNSPQVSAARKEELLRTARDQTVKAIPRRNIQRDAKPVAIGQDGVRQGLPLG